jgi:hypothetical protein
MSFGVVAEMHPVASEPVQLLPCFTAISTCGSLLVGAPQLGDWRNGTLRRIPSIVAKSASDSFALCVGFWTASHPSGVTLRTEQSALVQFGGIVRPRPSMKSSSSHAAGELMLLQDPEAHIALGPCAGGGHGGCGKMQFA